MNKTCSKCAMELSPDRFGPSKQSRDGLNYACRGCLAAGAAVRRAADPEKHREAVRKHKAVNGNAVREQGRMHKREVRANESPAAYEARLRGMREYQARARPWIKRKRTQRDVDYARKYTIEKYRANPGFAVQMNLSRRIRAALGKQKKSNTLAIYLGCSLEELRTHLQSKFSEGMAWGNYGKWHVDHIKPCASFDLSDPVEQKRCFHFSNLQPLWAKDNLAKGDRV